jgi:hypothetical protein
VAYRSITPLALTGTPVDLNAAIGAGLNDGVYPVGLDIWVDSGTAYWGGPTVTTSNGIAVVAGGGWSWDLEPGETVWLTGTATVRVVGRGK